MPTPRPIIHSTGRTLRTIISYLSTPLLASITSTMSTPNRNPLTGKLIVRIVYIERFDEMEGILMF